MKKERGKAVRVVKAVGLMDIHRTTIYSCESIIFDPNLRGSPTNHTSFYFFHLTSNILFILHLIIYPHMLIIYKLTLMITNLLYIIVLITTFVIMIVISEEGHVKNDFDLYSTSLKKYD